jgi:hypothetical protein
MSDKLYWVSEDDGSGEYLSGSPAGYRTARIADWSTIPAQELADYLDQTAEGCNAHDFCGAHRALAALLVKVNGEKAAQESFVMLAKVGGLHGMTGVAGAKPGPTKAAEILGVSREEAGHW